MKRSTKTMRLAAVAAASALVLAACGGGGDDGGDDEEASSSRSDGVLTFGTLLPQTGSLAFLGPPEFAGVDLAVEEINEAGGVLGEDVVHVRGDSGDTDTGIAPAETDALLDADSDVIVGAAASGVSLTVIDKILSAGSVMFSPANTSTDFDTGDYAEPDLYFRTAPSDILQGAVLSNLLIQDGKQNVAILARQDSYGETLAEEVGNGLEAAGSTVAATVFYGENAQSYDSQVAEIEESDPDAVLLIAFEETTTIIPQLVTAGVGPQDVDTYFVDGNTADYSEDLDPGILEGTKGTIPGADSAGEFQDRLLEIDPDLDSFAYGPESYDSVIVSALAAIAAESDAGDAIAENMVDVTREGTKCTTFQECADLLAEGEDIDYDGVSGPIEFGETGSPTAASIGVYEFDENNQNSPIEFIDGTI
ncbi:ABC transporter substrate-binding protein [Aeromicrobium sp. CF4.19]|uniref:ABC transporter substrate-binding protein n=1 Tax=Aeromicrobium sp. CF4.19 TaxID=3373082 RepID=UPI003EE60946